MRDCSPIHRQRGVSMIGLLIGLFISMLCILVSLTLYRNLVQVATGGKFDALHDGQLSTAMLITQLEVQSAGYGIENAGSNHVVRLKNAGDLRLLWRFFDGAVFRCRGLHETQVEHNGLNTRVLRMVQVTSGCDGTTPLTSMTWVDLATIGRWPVVADSPLAKYIEDNDTLLEFNLSNAVCSPFGADTSASDVRLMLRVSAPGSAMLHGATGVTQNSYDYCLPNIAPI